MSETKKTKAVFAITPERRDRDGKVTRREGDGFWVEVGRAIWNHDDTINVYLDAVPVTGKLQIRDPRKKPEAAPAGAEAGS